METRHRFGLATGIVIATGLLGLLFAPELPDQVAIHWNAAGEPDGTMSKTVALAFLPVITAVLLVLFAVVPRIDPLGENIEAFRAVYDWFVVVFVAFLGMVHAGVIAFNLGYEFDFTLLVLAGVAGLFYVVGIVLTRAQRNWFVGIRTPWTLTSDEVWERTHELGGKLFKLTAVIALFGLLFGEYAVYFLLVPAIGTAIITVVYSYYLYEHVVDVAEPTP